MRIKAKVISVLLALLIVFSQFPAIPAYAVEDPIVATIAMNETWTMNISDIFSCPIEANISFRNLDASNGGNSNAAHVYLDDEEESFDDNGTFAMGYTAIKFMATAAGTYKFKAYYDQNRQCNCFSIYTDSRQNCICQVDGQYTYGDI